MQRHHIDVALHQNDIGLLGLFRKVHTKEIFPLVEDQGLVGVEILGLGVIQHPAAKADHIAPDIENGEHQPVAETVVNSAVFLTHQVCIPQLLIRIPLLAHGIHKGIPGIGGKADAKPGDCGFCQTPLLHIRETFCAHRGKKLLVEEAACLFHQRPQALLMAVTALVLLILRHFHACPLGKGTDCIRVGKSFNLHHKIHCTAAFMAAEAIVNSLIRCNGKGCCLFPVEGAKTKQIRAGSLQAHILAHHILNGISGNQFINKRLGKSQALRLLSKQNNLLYHIIPEHSSPLG